MEAKAHACRATMVIIEIYTVKLDEGGMYAQCAPLREREVLGGGKLETGKVGGALAYVLKRKVSTARILVATWIIGAKHYLR